MRLNGISDTLPAMVICLSILWEGFLEGGTPWELVACTRSAVVIPCWQFCACWRCLFVLLTLYYLVVFLSQAAEAVMQLGGNAGPNQVRKNGALPKRVLSQSIGGAATSVYTHIFEA